MNAISVGYRFARTELSTLLQALRLKPLPGAPLGPVDPATAASTLEQLNDKGIALVADGTIYVDRLVDFLLRSTSEARSAVVVTDGSHTLVLWDAEQLFILGDFPEQGECALTPLQDRAAAQSALVDGISRQSRPLWYVNPFDSASSPQAFPGKDVMSDPEAAAAVLELLLRPDRP